MAINNKPASRKFYLFIFVFFMLCTIGISIPMFGTLFEAKTSSGTVRAVTTKYDGTIDYQVALSDGKTATVNQTCHNSNIAAPVSPAPCRQDDAVHAVGDTVQVAVAPDGYTTFSGADSYSGGGIGEFLGVFCILLVFDAFSFIGLVWGGAFLDKTLGGKATPR